MAKYIFVTGGVVSSLGKGITASSMGALIKASGHSVNMMKIDPYLNVDAGTIRPYEHGEVFVLDDGTETDLDLGNYERYVQIRAAKDSAITTGRIYQKVIESERRGEYLGQTVQVIPHITDEIKRRIRTFDKTDADVCIVELGGTIGDVESLPFVEALRQFITEEGRENVMFVHLTLVPTVTSGEIKTKPSQHSVKTLMSDGIHPDMLICRSELALNKDIKEKLALFCNVPVDAVLSLPNVKKTIYEIPIILYQENLLESIEKRLNLSLKKKIDISPWKKFVDVLTSAAETVDIAFVGKYLQLEDAYKSVFEAFTHASVANSVKINFHPLNPELLEKDDPETLKLLETVDGIFVPGGFGIRGILGKMKALQFGRENKVPTFGICLGLQCMVMEYARNVLGLEEADSTEFVPDTAVPVVDMLGNLKGIRDLGGTMRLGAYKAKLLEGSLAAKIYGSLELSERHRHRYEVNPQYVQALKDGGLVVSGTGPSDLVEIVEVSQHPFYLGVQFHPEFLSSPLNPHPVFKSFVSVVKKQRAEKACKS